MMEQLLDAGDGLVRLVTLAPECDTGLRVTCLLANRGVIVAAGHTDASLEQLQAAVDVDSACSLTLAMAARRSSRGTTTSCSVPSACANICGSTFVADGVHVPWFALGNYSLCLPERCLVVTDAIAPAGLGPGQDRFGRWHLNIGDDLVAQS